LMRSLGVALELSGSNLRLRASIPPSQGARR